MNTPLAQGIRRELERRERYRELLRRVAREDSDARLLLEALFDSARLSKTNGNLTIFGEFMLTMADRYEMEKSAP